MLNGKQDTVKNYRENGIVYTPNILAEYVAQKTIYYFIQDYKKYRRKNKDESSQINKIGIIDPACGDGILLEAIWKELKALNNEIPSQSYLNLEETIYGIDIDSKAINICKSRFSNLEETLDIKNLKLINTNALCPLNENSVVNGVRKLFSAEDGFDIFIANPPWGADISKYKHKLNTNVFQTLNGQFDSYELFIELAMAIVKRGGYFSFIIPDSILNHDKKLLRSILLKNTQIKFISRLGEKIFPNINRSCVILICKNDKPNPLSETDCFRLDPIKRKMILKGDLKFNEAEKIAVHKIKQSRFISNPEYIFDIDLKESEKKVLRKMTTTSDTLKKYLLSSRGVELSGDGKICQCPACYLWLPYPKSTSKCCPHCGLQFELENSIVKQIISEEKSKNMVSLINGYDTKRYQCKPSKWIVVDIPGIKYKDVNLFKGKKLLVRKTGVGISASIDYSGAHTTQVVYIFKLKEKTNPLVTLEFILSLINSRAYYFYITKCFGEIEWRSHPYLTQNQILNLPFPDIKNKEQEKIVTEITKLMEPCLQKNLELPDSIDSEVEYLISKLCKLTRADYDIIYRVINQVEELLPVKALKKIQINDIFKPES